MTSQTLAGIKKHIQKIKAELTAMGLKNVRDGGPRSVHVDDPFGYDVQITGLESHALSEG